jgi:murein DD-endopeptidase MepM/ murein hydrolase activator NlpD
MSFLRSLKFKKHKVYISNGQKIYVSNHSKYSTSKKVLVVLSIFSLIFLGFNLFSVLGTPDFNIQSLRSENKSLKKELKAMMSNYNELSGKIDSLAKTNNDLRLAVNLHPISEDELKVGVGGGYFDNSIDFLSNDAEDELRKATSFVDEISRKIEFERAQFLEITNQLKENRKLSLCIPAIKPCLGVISDGFGLRMHPILHIRRMHEGLDFIADVGSSVYATGDGRVSFVGRKGGYGLTVELDHGFGYHTIYAHLSKVLVKEGQKISRGSIIAKTGDSGLSTGPHLHYEVEHNGVKENPAGFFFDNLDLFALTNKK